MLLVAEDSIYELGDYHLVQVWLLPSFSDAQRSALLAAATAVLYTPVNEHFGIVPLEAMAAGLAVLNVT